jgi:phage/plasmid-associated DNA primase
MLKTNLIDLHKRKYIAYNVGKNKAPINAITGMNMKNWSKMGLDEIKPLCDYDNENIGMKMGIQENGRHILCIDFDVAKKVDGKYVDCEKTKKMLDDYRKNNNEDGMYESATLGNMNILIDYTDANKVREKISELNGLSVIKQNDIGLELLVQSNSVLPPTPTICKKTDTLRPRKSLNNILFKNITDDDYTSNFILDFIDTARPKKNALKKSKQKDEQKNEQSETNTQTDEEECRLFLDLIDIKYWDDFNDWKRIVWALKAESISKEIALEYSQKSDNFDDWAFDDIWDNSPQQITLTMGTIKYYAKRSNPKQYNEYVYAKLMENKNIEKMVYNYTDRNLAVLGEILLDDDIIYTEEKQLYFYNNNFWVSDEDVIKYTLQHKICSLLDSVNIKLSIERQECGDVESDEYKTLIKKQTAVNTTLTQICSNTKLNNVYSQLKILLSLKKQSIKFDVKKPNVFCFKNIAFDLTTNEEYIIQKDDYISLHSGYDYIEPTQEQIDEIKKIFADIFPSEEMRKTYMSILRTGLSGIRQEKLFIANGKGRNGKGLLNELMSATCGNYYYKMNIDILTKNIKSGANVEVSSLHQKRFCVANEPNCEEGILGGNIKRLTGDNTINARGLYSQNTETILYGTYVLELNKLINFNGRIDDAIVSRLVNIQFKTYFTDDENILANNTNARRLNPYYKEDDFRDTYRHALFYYLLIEAPKKLYVCEDAKKATRDYLLSNNEFYNWINEHYEKIENPTIHDYISLKDVYDLWKTSDYYTNMSKAQKRKALFKKFKSEYIEDNMELKPYFVEKYQKYENGVRINTTNVILSFKKRPKKCMVDMDDEE